MTDRRSALFDAIREFAPERRFLPSHVQVIDALADSFGMQRMDARKTSTAGRNLIRDFEGERLTAYPDPATNGDPWTIGVGHTGPDVHKGLTITREHSDKLLSDDLARFEAGVNKLASETTQAQFDALVSFSFNVGLGNLTRSTLLKKHNAGDYAGAQAEFAKWNKAAGKVMPGLTRRRAAEAAMYGGKA